MSDTTGTISGFDVDLYQRSRRDIFELKSQLTETAVVDLAREVLRRIEARGVVAQKASTTPSQGEIDKLCYALISDDDSEGTAFIDGLRADGATIETVYLSYLAAAARTLGAWWDDDSASFAEVAMGTSRIYGILRALSHLDTFSYPCEHRTAIFISVPGETHTFGVRMAADLFRKEGWEIDLKIGLQHEYLIEQVEQTRPRLVGVSCGGEHAVDALARLVIALRIASPKTKIALSGKAVVDYRAVVDLMGADAIVTDVKEAQAIFAGLWDHADAIRNVN